MTRAAAPSRSTARVANRAIRARWAVGTPVGTPRARGLPPTIGRGPAVPGVYGQRPLCCPLCPQARPPGDCPPPPALDAAGHGEQPPGGPIKTPRMARAPWRSGVAETLRDQDQERVAGHLEADRGVADGLPVELDRLGRVGGDLDHRAGQVALAGQGPPRCERLD